MLKLGASVRLPSQRRQGLGASLSLARVTGAVLPVPRSDLDHLRPAGPEVSRPWPVGHRHGDWPGTSAEWSRVRAAPGLSRKQCVRVEIIESCPPESTSVHHEGCEEEYNMFNYAGMPRLHQNN